MKAVIKISKEAALLAGENEFGDIKIDFDPADLTEEQREELSKWTKDDLFLANRAPFHFYSFNRKEEQFVHKNLPVYSVADHDTLKDILNERIRLRSEFRKKSSEALRLYHDSVVEHLHDIVAQDASEMIRDDFNAHAPMNRSYSIKFSSAHSFIGEGHFRKKDVSKHLFGGAIHFEPGDAEVLLSEMDPAEYEDRVPGITAKVQEIKDYVAAKKAEAKAAAERLKAEKEAKWQAEMKAEKERERNQRQQIADWVAAHGTENQKARHKEGMLPDKEVIDAIRDEAYQPMADWPRYKKMMASDVCCCESGYYDEDSLCEVEFFILAPDDADFPGLTDNEYERLHRIRKAMPNANVEPRLHVGEAEHCENKERKMGYMVRVTVGVFEFSREYE